MALEPPFSRRHGFSGAKDITVREDAPENLRSFVLDTAGHLGCRTSRLREVLYRVLRVPMNERYVLGERRDAARNYTLITTCDWFKVYDIIEELYACFAASDEPSDEHDREDNARVFANEINEFFIVEGIGWQISDGKIVTRGTEALEAVVTGAISTLEASDRPTAAKCLHDALQDLSRRPEADLRGAANHAVGALECVARDLTGDTKDTLGQILKRDPPLVPKPLDIALSKVWGYASNVTRHVVEGREISRDEAELLVGLSAAVSTYLLRKQTPQ